MTSSHSIIKIAPDEWLKFDGETTRLALNYRYGVTDRLEFGVEFDPVGICLPAPVICFAAVC